MEFGQIHHAEYYVNDLQRTSEFWGWFLSELGYVEYQKWESGISWKHRNGTYLVFVQVLSEFLQLENNRQGNGLNHLAFMGGSIDELDKLQANLEMKAIKILKRTGAYLCFEDPNLFAVEVYAREG